MPSRSEVRVFSDFDNTMIPVNAGVELASYYLWNGKGSLAHRIHRVIRIRRILHATMMERYYRLLHAIPSSERCAVLAGVPLNERWVEAIQDLRFKHRARTVRLTIISRNSVDVINEWLHTHASELKARHIVVDMVIANKPLDDQRHEYVVEHGFQHIDRAGIGELDVEHKRQFLPPDAIYLGDPDEEVLSDGVAHFVRI